MQQIFSGVFIFCLPQSRRNMSQLTLLIRLSISNSILTFLFIFIIECAIRNLEYLFKITEQSLVEGCSLLGRVDFLFKASNEK
jgi:hypothetical protein